MKSKQNLYVIFIFLFGLVFNGCTLVEIKQQTEFADNLSIIKGRVSLSEQLKDSNRVVVVLLKQSKEYLLQQRNYVIAETDGSYRFKVALGTYVVGAFVDANNDNYYQRHEQGDVYGEPAFIDIKPGQEVQADILINGRLNKRINYDSDNFDQTHLSIKNIGKVVSLTDARFKKENGWLGLWRPIDFLERYGAGLFLLQKYEKNKVPVIFVHGANGGANDWGTVINKLDRNYFQPWLFNYPSGMRLDIVSDYFNRAVNELQKKYNFDDIYIVAHSMGGLVARSFVMKYQIKYPEQFNKIKFVMTVNSPMMGMASASNGVEYSPIVVPSWRDITPQSQFLKRMHAWRWPKTIPYHLVFSYIDGEGDGVVDLQSQIPLGLQSEATRTYGFNASHSGILKDDVFIKQFNQILKQSLTKL